MNDRLLNCREVADRLGVSTATVLRWHHAGRLPGGRRLASKVLRWPESDIDAWLEAKRELPQLVNVVSES